MKTALKGIIRGTTIHLEESPDLPDGQLVDVTLEPTTAGTSPTSPEALERLRRAAGTWCDDPDGLDRYLEWNHRQRKVAIEH